MRWGLWCVGLLIVAVGGGCSDTASERLRASPGGSDAADGSEPEVVVAAPQALPSVETTGQSSVTPSLPDFTIPEERSWSVYEGDSFRESIEVTGAVGALRLVAGPSEGPPGLEVVLEGERLIVQGQPTRAGSFEWTLTLRDGAGRQASVVVQLLVVPGLRVPTTTVSVEGCAWFETNFNALGGVGPLHWSNVVVPEGVSASTSTAMADRLLVQGWVRPGTHTLTAEVRDAHGRIQRASWTVTASAAVPRDRWLVYSVLSLQGNTLNRAAWAADLCLPETQLYRLSTSTAGASSDPVGTEDLRKVAFGESMGDSDRVELKVFDLSGEQPQVEGRRPLDVPWLEVEALSEDGQVLSAHAYEGSQVRSSSLYVARADESWRPKRVAETGPGDSALSDDGSRVAYWSGTTLRWAATSSVPLSSTILVDSERRWGFTSFFPYANDRLLTQDQNQVQRAITFGAAIRQVPLTNASDRGRGHFVLDPEHRPKRWLMAHPATSLDLVHLTGTAPFAVSQVPGGCRTLPRRLTPERYAVVLGRIGAMALVQVDSSTITERSYALPTAVRISGLFGVMWPDGHHASFRTEDNRHMVVDFGAQPPRIESLAFEPVPDFVGPNGTLVTLTFDDLRVWTLPFQLSRQVSLTAPVGQGWMDYQFQPRFKGDGRTVVALARTMGGDHGAGVPVRIDTVGTYAGQARLIDGRLTASEYVNRDRVLGLRAGR